MMAEEVSVAKEDRKLFGKSRWRGKIFSSEDSIPKEPKQPKQKFQLNDDVVDFLKPSTQKAFATAPKPKIDVAAAQRWPGASDIKKDQSPSFNGPSSLRGKGPGKRGKMLTVAFVRTAPEVIGVGGDMSEEPSIEISRRKTTRQPPSNPTRLPFQDDSKVGMRSPPMNGSFAAQQEDPSQPVPAEDRSAFPRRFNTSHGELSPPMRQKIEAYNAAQQSDGPPPGDGLGFRPSPLKRIQTGRAPPTEGVVRPSFDSDDFRPKPLRRTQTGWSDSMNLAEEDEETSSLSEVNVGAEGMAREYMNETGNLLDSSPSDPHSFAAQIQHKMRAEEGKALHEAMLRRQVDESRRPSSSDSGGSAQSLHQSPGRSSHERTFSPARSSPEQRFPFPTSRPSLERPSAHQRPSALQYSSYLEPSRPDSAASGDYAGARLQEPINPQPLPSPRGLQPENQAQMLFNSSQVPSSRASPNLTLVPPSSPGFQPPSGSGSPTKGLLPDQSSLAAPPPTRSRADSNAARDAAFDDFADRITHMQGIFRLTAEIEQPISSYTLTQCLRAAFWWFLRGRAGLEAIIRSRPRNGGSPPQERLMQPHVDLAKTWWLLTQVIPNHAGLRKYGDHEMTSQSTLAREAGDHEMAEIYEAYDIAVANLKALLSSMAKHFAMPPYQSLIQGQDQTIWVQYPKFASDVSNILAGSLSKSLVVEAPKRSHNPMSIMPLGDTRNDFCYGRMFVQASLATDDPDTDRVTLPCVLSILRPKEDYGLKLTVCSQNELVNILVQNDRKVGPTWEEVGWKSRSRGLYIQLGRGFTLNVELQESDYRQLANIYDYTRRVEHSLQPEEDETMIHEVTLRDFHYVDPINPQAFPAERMRRCRIRIFETTELKMEGTGERQFHRGYRLLVVTSPKFKTLSSVTHHFGAGKPISFEFKADGESPAVIIYATDVQKQATMYFVFHDQKERSKFFACLNGLSLRANETVFAQLPLKGFMVTHPDDASLGREEGPGGVMSKFQWQDVKVLNADSDKGSSEVPRTVLSENLRIVARHAAGSLTDWMNLSPGELQIRLDTSGTAEIQLQRIPQEDLASSIDLRRCEKGAPEALTEILQTMMTSQTIRTFAFNNLEDLYRFETAITGFTVRFDGVAHSLRIARRRMVVPIYKKWEAQNVRVQIVSRESSYQLVAFFDGFSHAEAMAFTIKSMDVFEKVDKKHGVDYGLKLVDAKFALPGGKGEGREGKGAVKSRFVCLDLLEYAGEHDDITIGFNSQEERDRFCEALPAATQVVTMTLRRKI